MTPLSSNPPPPQPALGPSRNPIRKPPPATGAILTPEQVRFIASRGQWYIDIAFSPRNSPMAFGDSVTFTGQGLKDINQVIGVVSSNSAFGTPCRITCEIGSAGTVTLGNAFPKYSIIHIEDLYNLKDAFIAYYGSVDKPSVYRAFGGGSLQVSHGTVLLKVDLTGTAAGSNSPPYFMPNG